MPLYSYECPSCGASEKSIPVPYEERNKVQCAKCEKIMRLLPCTPRVHFFKGGWFEHIAPTPMYIETPEQLHKACEANDGFSPYLNESPLGKGLRKKEI